MVRARRGVIILSGAGSSALLRNTTERSSAPVSRNSSMNSRLSSSVIPMPAKTTANSSVSFTSAWRATCFASSLCGRPEPEKIGSFWPFTNVFVTSIVDTPVCMKSSGSSRENGFMASPWMSRSSSGITSGPPSIGSPVPSRTRPSRSSVTGIFTDSPRNRTLESLPTPCVSS